MCELGMYAHIFSTTWIWETPIKTKEVALIGATLVRFH